MSKITLEDINTWLMKYEYQTIIFTLDCLKTIGNYGLFSIEGGSVRSRYVKLYLPASVKIYYPTGAISYNSSRDWIILQDGDFQLTVILDTTFIDESSITTKHGQLDWSPLSPTKCLRLPYDYLDHRKLYLEIKNSNITSINYHDIKDRDTDKPYVTYGDIYNSLSDEVLWSNIDEGSRYPFKIIDIPSCPHVTANQTLYRGNNNSLTDLIDLPNSNIEYKVYYQGKELNDSLFIPSDYNEDTIRLRVVTKSYEPYVGTDVYINVPVETKVLTTLEDLNNYNYGCISLLENITGEINNDITIVRQDNASALTHCNLTINGNVEFEDLSYIEQTLITNNSNLKIKGTDINSEDYTGFEWVNNGRLTLDNVTIHSPSGFILNNNEFNLINSVINDDLDGDKNLPFLHSTTSNYTIMDNTFELSNNKAGYNICLIRCNDIDIDNIILNNNIQYNCLYDHDNVEYSINGNGVAYCLIDEDTIILKDLEMNENV